MPSDVDERIRGLLEKLRMTAAIAALVELLPADKALRTASLEVIERVLRVEVDRRREKRIIRRVDHSKLPDRPTLENFDFDFQPTLDKGSSSISPPSHGSIATRTSSSSARAASARATSRRPCA
jgi:hypothetical protein